MYNPLNVTGAQVLMRTENYGIESVYHLSVQMYKKCSDFNFWNTKKLNNFDIVHVYRLLILIEALLVLT